MAYTIKVNGAERTADVDGDTPLLWVLRDVLGMTGPNSAARRAFAAPARCSGTAIRSDPASRRSTAWALRRSRRSRRLPIRPTRAKIQKAWIDLDVPQCGYCQSGQIMSASALLAGNPHPSDSDIDDAMSGNICRCGTYVRIREAIKRAAADDGHARQGD